MEKVGDKRLYISRWGEGVNERVRECVRVCVFYDNTKLWTQFYISGLLGNRDGSDQSAHLCNLIGHFFRISSEMDAHT